MQYEFNYTHTPRLLALVVAIALIAAFFLPFFGLSQEDQSALDSVQDVTATSSGLTFGDLKQFSPFNLLMLYKDGKFPRSASDNQTLFIITAIMGGLCLLGLLWAFANKPLLLLINTALLGLITWLSLSDDGLYSGVGSGGVYKWRFGSRVYLVGVPLLFVIGLWLFIARHRKKVSFRNQK